MLKSIRYINQNVGLCYYLCVAKFLSNFTMSRSPHKLPVLTFEGNYMPHPSYQR